MQPLLAPDEAASVLRERTGSVWPSTSTLARWRRVGIGPPWVRLGGPARGRVLYPRAQLERWARAPGQLASPHDPGPRHAA